MYKTKKATKNKRGRGDLLCFYHLCSLQHELQVCLRHEHDDQRLCGFGRVHGLQEVVQGRHEVVLLVAPHRRDAEYDGDAGAAARQQVRWTHALRVVQQVRQEVVGCGEVQGLQVGLVQAIRRAETLN